MVVAVFVIDGHDIELYPDAATAASEVEGYDAFDLEYLGADGTVYRAAVDGPDWGPVTLHRTDESRVADLILLLRSEAAFRGFALPPDMPDDPEAIWLAIRSAEETKARS
jgi:hypothetical protein